MGECKIERNTTTYKGELFFTPYRLVFVEKSRILDSNWISFWWKPDFGGRVFEVEAGVIRPALYQCKDMILQIEQKGMRSFPELAIDLLQHDNTLANRNKYYRPWRFHRSDLLVPLQQAKANATPINVATLGEHINQVRNNMQQFTFGPWDFHLEMAMKAR